MPTNSNFTTEVNDEIEFVYPKQKPLIHLLSEPLPLFSEKTSIPMPVLKVDKIPNSSSHKNSVCSSRLSEKSHKINYVPGNFTWNESLLAKFLLDNKPKGVPGLQFVLLSLRKAQD